MRFALLVILLFASAPRASATVENGQTFDGPGGRLYYEVVGSGSGTPLVLVNGGPGFDHTYLHIAAAWDTLAKNRRIIFYDQRGDGGSAPLKPGQSCTLADQIADLEALRTHLVIEKWDMLGHSWGGYLSMAYAARHSEHIAHLADCRFCRAQMERHAFPLRRYFFGDHGAARRLCLCRRHGRQGCLRRLYS
jgi:proline iminopeptidase